MFAMIAAALLNATAPERLIPGAWAAGDSADACETAAITVFFTDGSLVIFDSPSGPVHAVATWRFENGDLFMSYNRAPFPAGGVSNPARKILIRELSAERFVTENADGLVRRRVRCSDLVVPITN